MGVSSPANSQREHVKNIFRQCDKNGDGGISVDELATLLKALGRFQTNEIKMIFSRMDTNGDGVIQFDEFVDWIFGANRQESSVKAKVALLQDDSDAFQMAFYNICGAGQTEMDGKSLTRLCKEADLFDKSFPPGEADVIFRKAIGNGRTKVTFDQFPEVVRAIAERKAVPFEEVRKAILRCGVSQPPPRIGLAGVTAAKRVGRSRSRAEAGAPRPMTSSGGPASSSSPLCGLEVSRPMTSPAGPMAANVREAFKSFCGGRPDVDCDGFVELCESAGFVDGRFSSAHARAIFQQVAANGQTRISFRQFEQALAKIASKKNLTEEAAELAVRSSKSDSGEASMSKSAGFSVSFASEVSERESVVSPQPTGKGMVRRAMSEKHFAKTTSEKGKLGRVASEKTFTDGAGPRRAMTRGLLGDDLPGLPPLTRSRPSSPSSQVDPRVSSIFQTFCSGAASDIDGKGFAKFCKDSGLVDRQFTPADVDIVFAEVMGQSRRMATAQFEEALKKIAGKKKTDVRSVESSILGCNGPSISATVVDYVRLHDDFIDRPTAQGVSRSMA